MPYRGSRDEAVYNVDGCDPTPYSGGYDLSLTYGRPLQPSEDICYPVSGNKAVDYGRPHYSSGSQASAYEVKDDLKGDCYGLLRPNQQPAYSSLPQPQRETSTGYPGYGYKSYGSEGFGGGGFAGVSHGQRPQLHDFGSSDYASGYYARPQRHEHGFEYGSEHRSGYAWQAESFGYGYSGYSRSEEEGHGRQVYGGSEYRRSEKEAGGGHRRHGGYVYEENLNYERQIYGVRPEQSGGHWNLGYGEGGSGMYSKSSYCNDEQRTGYIKPSYYVGKEGKEYGSSKYGNDSDDEEKRQRHWKHHHRHNYAG